MTLVIICGGIDLSVGSMLALVAVCSAQMAIHWSMVGWLVVPACLIGWWAGGVFAVLSQHAFESSRLSPRWP